MKTTNTSKDITIKNENYAIQKKYTGKNIEKDKNVFHVELLKNEEKVGEAIIHEAEDHIFLERIKIKENHRGKGLGTKLLQEIISYGKPMYLDILYSLPENFYKRLGFVYDSPDTMSLDLEKIKNEVTITSGNDMQGEKEEELYTPLHL